MQHMTRDSDKIYVVERTPEGKRTYKEIPANYTFYYSDLKGKYRSLNGIVSKFSTRKRAEFEKEKGFTQVKSYLRVI